MSAAVQTETRPREFAFGQDDHAAIARIVYDEAGILLPPAKMQLVYGRLARRLRARGLGSFAEYLSLLNSDRAERDRAIDALTTNHTSFFRENHHFEHFVETVWPVLNKRLAEGGRVRLWSAACSSGEEPYTLLMSALGCDARAAEQLARRDFRFLATDLSSDILTAARAGRYAADVAETVPAQLRKTWLKPVDAMFEMRPELRNLVSFRSLNLLREWPMKGRFDVIFCRNVMIYFDEPTKTRLQTRLSDCLETGGHMYIGHSERLVPQVDARFTSVGRTMYRKN